MLYVAPAMLRCRVLYVSVEKFMYETESEESNSACSDEGTCFELERAGHKKRDS